ncbi:LysR family transcriptional regulator [Pseudoprimorskyibacter insulae]|nr:LysR family transcriptional regulator [Pseudoprimorskyibacter insulae]
MESNWDDLKAVLFLVRHGTLAAAGSALGVAYTTVARRVERMEKAVGTPLFERLTDGYRVTEAGREVAYHAEQMEQQHIALERRLAGQDQHLRGSLTVTAPQLLIAACLAKPIGAFADAHPDVDLTIRATNDLLDLNRREADLAIRVSNDPGDTLTGLRLAEQAQASFATPDLANRIAADPAACVEWVMHVSAKGPPKPSLASHPNARVKLWLDDMVAILGAAQAGLGVVRLPMFLGRSTPGLVQVPILPPQPYIPIWCVAHRDVWKGGKVRAFREALVAYFRENRDQFT